MDMSYNIVPSDIGNGIACNLSEAIAAQFEIGQDPDQSLEQQLSVSD